MATDFREILARLSPDEEKLELPPVFWLHRMSRLDLRTFVIVDVDTAYLTVREQDGQHLYRIQISPSLCRELWKAAYGHSKKSYVSLRGYGLTVCRRPLPQYGFRFLISPPIKHRGKLQQFFDRIKSCLPPLRKP